MSSSTQWIHHPKKHTWLSSTFPLPLDTGQIDRQSCSISPNSPEFPCDSHTLWQLRVLQACRDSKMLSYGLPSEAQFRKTSDLNTLSDEAPQWFCEKGALSSVPQAAKTEVITSLRWQMFSLEGRIGEPPGLVQPHCSPFCWVQWEGQECRCRYELLPPAPQENDFSRTDSYPGSLGAGLILFSSLGTLNRQPQSEDIFWGVFYWHILFQGPSKHEDVSLGIIKGEEWEEPSQTAQVHRSSWASIAWTCMKQALHGAGRSLNIS